MSSCCLCKPVTSKAASVFGMVERLYSSLAERDRLQA
jgi:hypothetical protein